MIKLKRSQKVVLLLFMACGWTTLASDDLKLDLRGGETEIINADILTIRKIRIENIASPAWITLRWDSRTQSFQTQSFGPMDPPIGTWSGYLNHDLTDCRGVETGDVYHTIYFKENGRCEWQAFECKWFWREDRLVVEWRGPSNYISGELNEKEFVGQDYHNGKVAGCFRFRPWVRAH